MEVTRALKGSVPDLHMGIWTEIEEVVSVKTKVPTTSARTGLHCA